MIYIDLNGRCGDQFFQYAFARKIQMKIGDYEALQLNFYNQQRWRNKINDASFRNDLCHFKIVNNNAFVNESQNIKRFGTKKQNNLLKKYYFVRRVTNKFKMNFFAKLYQKHLQRYGIFYDDEFFSFYCYPKKTVNVFLRGYFEDYRFYEDAKLRSVLSKELVPVFSSASKNPLFKAIKDSESICVSMRSWNEVAQFNDVVKSRFVCDKNYFSNAIKKMKELHPNCSFFIFSDDPDFAKRNIGNDPSFIFENEGNSIEDKIILMSACKHFIISNSSFSWWIQYLSKNDAKTIISPNRWYNDRVDNRLIEDNWIKF